MAGSADVTICGAEAGVTSACLHAATVAKVPIIVADGVTCPVIEPALAKKKVNMTSVAFMGASDFIFTPSQSYR